MNSQIQELAAEAKMSTYLLAYGLEFYNVQLIGCDQYYWSGCGGLLSWGY
jgi:hypothetical protein